MDERKRRARQVRYAAFGSATVAALIAGWFVHPATDAIYGDSWIYAAGGGFVLTLFAVGLAAEGDFPRLTERLGCIRLITLIASLPPLALLIAAAALAPAHASQDRLVDVFRTYTHRFPPGLLHDVWIETRHDDVGIVCAEKGARRPFGHQGGEVQPAFCLDIDASAPAGRKVLGGYNLQDADDSIGHRSKCFGHPILSCDGG